MGVFNTYFSEFINNVWMYLTNIKLVDILDILIVAFVFYKVIVTIRRTSAMQVVKGIVIIVIIAALARMIGLNVVSYLLDNTLQVGLIAVVIMFQPELRRFLEQMGGTKLSDIVSKETLANNNKEIENVISNVVEACEQLSSERTGALIVFERTVYLEDYVKNGTVLNADVSAELIKNLFFVKAALHDGAIIISKNKIAGAGCTLPLSSNTNLSKDLGMRHKAGIGVSENSDAIVVIVSEETGIISVAEGGSIKRHLAPETLEQILKNKLITKTDTSPKQVLKSIWKGLKDEKQ